MCEYSGKSELTRHALPKQHIKSSNENETKVGSGSIEKILTLASNSKEIVQHICIFLAEHNLPLNLADTSFPLLRILFPKDQVLEGVTLGQQKATDICNKIFLWYYATSYLSSSKLLFSL